MDEKGKYSTSPLQLKQTNPPCGNNYWTFKTEFKFLRFMSTSPGCSKHMETQIRGRKTYTFLWAERQDSKQIRSRGLFIWESGGKRNMSVSLCETGRVPKHFLFSGSQTNKLFSWVPLQTALWALGWLFGLPLTTHLLPSPAELGHIITSRQPSLLQATESPVCVDRTGIIWRGLLENAVDRKEWCDRLNRCVWMASGCRWQSVKTTRHKIVLGGAKLNVWLTNVLLGIRSWLSTAISSNTYDSTQRISCENELVLWGALWI